MMTTQAQLEADLINKDIRHLTETINWMVGQRLDARRIVLIRERNRFLAMES